MNSTETQDQAAMTLTQLQEHWLGHRRLTRRVIEAFPEDQLFSYSGGGMRPFGQMVWEVIDVTGYALHGLMTDEWPDPVLASAPPQDRQVLLAAWDDLSERLEIGLPTVPARRYGERKNLFWGPMTGFQLAIYQIDNEVHHRGQGYVYLRQLGIEPPPFWVR